MSSLHTFALLTLAAFFITFSSYSFAGERDPNFIPPKPEKRPDKMFASEDFVKQKRIEYAKEQQKSSQNTQEPELKAKDQIHGRDIKDLGVQDVLSKIDPDL